jgi:hypothetical protein
MITGDDNVVLGCDAVQTRRQMPTFRDKHAVCIFGAKDADSKFIRNVGICESTWSRNPDHGNPHHRETSNLTQEW